jgi:hypothetical protein
MQNASNVSWNFLVPSATSFPSFKHERKVKLNQAGVLIHILNASSTAGFYKFTCNFVVYNSDT